MNKIFSKIKKKTLLHIISRSIPKNSKRLDLTEHEMSLQVSRINLKNSLVKPHFNNKIKLNSGLNIQNECWIVLSGKISVSLFDIDKSKIKNLTLSKGEILITYSGGHSINEATNSSEIIELKLGPYKKKSLSYF